MKNSLPIAYSMRKQAQKKANGGMVKGMKADMEPHDHDSMMDSIRCKMSNGGMCGYAKGGMVDSDNDDDFLSDEMDAEAPMNDEMSAESGEIEGAGQARSALLNKILSKRMLGK